jgi:hypothetical protein
MPDKDKPCPGSKIKSKGKGRGKGRGKGEGPIGIPIGEKEEEMSEEKKAAEQEGTERLMAFAMGINRRCGELGIEYGALAKAAGVREEMLAPALVDVLVTASENTSK